MPDPRVGQLSNTVKFETVQKGIQARGSEQPGLYKESTCLGWTVDLRKKGGTWQGIGYIALGLLGLSGDHDKKYPLREAAKFALAVCLSNNELYRLPSSIQESLNSLSTLNSHDIAVVRHYGCLGPYALSDLLLIGNVRHGSLNFQIIIIDRFEDVGRQAESWLPLEKKRPLISPRPDL